MSESQTPSRPVVAIRVDATSYPDATARVMQWAREREARMVVAANVHLTMEAFDDAGYRRLINAADLITPDGMPLVWALRMQGVDAGRVYGPDLTLEVCRAAAKQGIPIGLYGSTPDCLEAFSVRMKRECPGLEIACSISPPFRELSEAEDRDLTRDIVDSGARILLVGLGCPKQERWIAQHRETIPAVMLGVGAAFAFYGGEVRQAPRWMMRLGLEWFFRLLMEPRRLWKRYAIHNPRFVALLLWQLATGRHKPIDDHARGIAPSPK